MAFLGKLNQVAKNIGDKTNDAIETTKQNSKIKVEHEAAAEELKKIGEYYYGLFAAGGEVAPEVLEFCQSAKTHYDTAAEAQAEIERIKAENEAPAPAPAGFICPSCGSGNSPGTKFCQSCGAKLEAPPPAVPEQKTCPDCGASVEPGVKFCPQCGNRME